MFGLMLRSTHIVDTARLRRERDGWRNATNKALDDVKQLEARLGGMSDTVDRLTNELDRAHYERKEALELADRLTSERDAAVADAAHLGSRVVIMDATIDRERERAEKAEADLASVTIRAETAERKLDRSDAVAKGNRTRAERRRAAQAAGVIKTMHAAGLGMPHVPVVAPEPTAALPTPPALRL